jgi:uncharacterized protein YbjT (DUF2867 family)
MSQQRQQQQREQMLQGATTTTGRTSSPGSTGQQQGSRMQSPEGQQQRGTYQQGQQGQQQRMQSPEGQQQRGTYQQGQQQQQQSQDKQKVLILTSTSHLGKALVGELTEGPFADKFQVIAGVPIQEAQERRDAIKQCTGAEHVEMDLEDVHKLAQSLNQMRPDKLVLVGRSESRNLQHLRNIIDAAGKMERPPFCLLMSVAQADLKNNRWAQEFDEVEHHLKSSELSSWAIVRSIMHAENFLWFNASVKEEGVLQLPYDKTLAPIATCDVTRAVALILKSTQQHQGKVLTLSGPQALNGQGVADALGKALHRSIQFKKMSLDQCRELLKAKGLSSTTIDPFVSYCEAVDRGDTYLVTNAYQVLSDAPGTSMEAFFRKHKQLFVSDREQ